MSRLHRNDSGRGDSLDTTFSRARDTSGRAKESEYSGSHDTVALAAFDGYAHVKVSFAPRSMPDMSPDGTIPMLQPEGVLAAGPVYVIDGSGVVCRIDRYGTRQNVTTFPITSAPQAVSFAVSPNGAHFMAAVLTYPAFTPGPTAYQPVVADAWELDLRSRPQVEPPMSFATCVGIRGPETEIGPDMPGTVGEQLNAIHLAQHGHCPGQLTPGTQRLPAGGDHLQP